MRGAASFAALVAAAAIVVFLPTLDAEPVIDDVPIVRENPVLARGNPVEILTTGWWSAVGNSEARLYRPVTMLSLWLDRDASGRVPPRRAHATNLALHAAGSVLLGLLLLRFGASPFASWSAAGLFAVHPVHVQPVSELVGRAELLALAFSLVAVLAWTATAAWSSGRPWAPASSPRTARAASWGSALAIFGALGSKEVAAGTLLLLPALDLLFRRPRREDVGLWLRDRAAASAPVVLALVVFVVLRTEALEAFPGLSRVSHYFNPLVTYPQPDRTWTALAVLGRYLALLVAPVRLGAEYAGPAIPRETSLFAPLSLLGLAALAGLLALVVRGAARPRAAFASLLFVFPYLVVGNLVFAIGVAMALRVLHLPAAGAAALAGLGLSAWAARGPGARRAATALLAVALALFGIRSWRASLDWRTETSLWAATERAVPANPTPHFLLGRAAARAGSLDEAERRFDEVLRLWPDNSAALHEKGVVRARKGDLEGARVLFQDAVRLNPWDGQAQADLGIALHRTGRIEEAERRLLHAMRTFPGIEKPVSELAEIRFVQRRYAEAAALYDRAVRLGRRDLEPRRAEARRLAAGR
jgi:tetratricopeptide (TPR) repeat protein